MKKLSEFLAEWGYGKLGEGIVIQNTQMFLVSNNVVAGTASAPQGSTTILLDGSEKVRFVIEQSYMCDMSSPTGDAVVTWGLIGGGLPENVTASQALDTVSGTLGLSIVVDAANGKLYFSRPFGTPGAANMLMLFNPAIPLVLTTSLSTSATDSAVTFTNISAVTQHL